MSDKLSTKELALLGALAAGEGRDERTPEAAALLGDVAVRADLDEDRRLVAALRALPEEVPSQGFGALEASIRQACARAEAPRRPWLARWRVPALGVSLVAAMAVALLWAAPGEGERGQTLAQRDAAPSAVAATLAADAATSEQALLEALAAPDELGSDEALEGLDDVSDDHAWELPADAAVTLGLTTDEGPERGDSPADAAEEAATEEVLGAWADDLDSLDGESLERVEAWLARAGQKG